MYQRRVIKIAYGYAGNIHDADDITQEVFITLYKNLDKLTSNEHLKMLIYKIAVSRSLDFLRKNRFKRFFSNFSQMEESVVDNLTDGKVQQEQEMLDKEFDTQLHNATRKLSPKQKSVFILKNHEGLSVKEISKITGMGEATVKTHQYRAIKTIRLWMRLQNKEKDHAK